MQRHGLSRRRPDRAVPPVAGSGNPQNNGGQEPHVVVMMSWLELRDATGHGMV
jgi:hypothetical protein